MADETSPARPIEVSDLPAAVHATLEPHQAAIAWWGGDDDRLSRMRDWLPASRPATITLAVPVRSQEGLRVEVRQVPCHLSDLLATRELLRNPAPDLRTPLPASGSVRFWREWANQDDSSVREDAVAGLAARMPVAAHCAVSPDGEHIHAAAETIEQADALVQTDQMIRAAGLNVRLRAYQSSGLAWLTRRSQDAAGAVLADEMGLGKTVQAICLMAGRGGLGPHLVLCPTSVLSNWRRELATFAPTLRTRLYHGSTRHLDPDDLAADVVVTSYATARTDRVALSGVDWDVVILDEAQQLKNPDAQVSRAVRGLPRRVTLAMTGTPIENRLDELWSILNLTDPGVLGDRTRFKQRFATPIERRGSARAAHRLHTLIAPHILRRTKKEVAPDLPAKIVAEVTCTLTDEQRYLYRDQLARAEHDGLGSGIQRHGRVLALLTALKQICNHPAQFLKQGARFGGRSGKLDRLTEMLGERDADDRFVIFTQYREAGTILSEHLAAACGMDAAPFLHGGLSASRRDDIVATFQRGDQWPVLIVSLKAAGFGINLTAANNVVHFDRWWNPAVEDQATDRAHRIGQTRTLSVYSLVTAGTLEDHIVSMHHSKRTIAGIATGDLDQSLSRLGDQELFDILSLRDEAAR